MSRTDEIILSLVKQIASNLDFPETHPFHNGLFTPVLRWVTAEKTLLQRLGTADLNAMDRERLWEMVTREFVDYRKSLGSGCIKMVEQTYRYATISLPFIVLE